MHRSLTTVLGLAALLFAVGPASAETPTAEALVAKAVDAAQGDGSMDTHDMIRVAIHQEETTSDGTSKERDMTAVFHGSRVENSRLELSHGVSLALSGKTGWAMIRGEVDSRPQSPKMAAGTIRQNLLPLLMPFSLQMDGVILGAVTQSSFDGTPAWVLHISFENNFFAAPSMIVPWRVFISKEDALVLGADFLPPVEFRKVADEGIRYRVLKRQDVDGVNLPAQVLMDGIDFNGVENGHVRVTKLEAESIGPLDLSLFISPETADKLDTDVVP